jgi:hypothetical protein
MLFVFNSEKNVAGTQNSFSVNAYGYEMSSYGTSTSGSGAAAADTGLLSANMKWRIHDGAESAPVLYHYGSNSAPFIYGMACYRGSMNRGWEPLKPPYLVSDGDATGTTFNATASTGPSARVGDKVVLWVAFPHDVGAASAWSISASGYTFGTITQRLTTTLISASNQGSGYLLDVDITAADQQDFLPSISCTTPNGFSDGAAQCYVLRERKALPNTILPDYAWNEESPATVVTQFVGLLTPENTDQYSDNHRFYGNGTTWVIAGRTNRSDGATWFGQYSSTDLLNWTHRDNTTPYTTNYQTQATYGDGYWVAGAGSAMRRSSDGTTWASVASPLTYAQSITYLGNAVWIAYSGGTGLWHRSTNGGDSWTSTTKASDPYHQIAHDGAGRVLIASSTTAANLSTDWGATWTAVTKPTSYFKTVWVNDRFITPNDSVSGTISWSYTGETGSWNDYSIEDAMPGFASSLLRQSFNSSFYSPDYHLLIVFGDIINTNLSTTYYYGANVPVAPSTNIQTTQQEFNHEVHVAFTYDGMQWGVASLKQGRRSFTYDPDQVNAFSVLCQPQIQINYENLGGSTTIQAVSLSDTANFQQSVPTPIASLRDPPLVWTADASAVTVSPSTAAAGMTYSTYYWKPDAILASSGLSGTVADIQDSPTAPGGTGLTPTGGAIDVRMSFENPGGNLGTSTNAQIMRILMSIP